MFAAASSGLTFRYVKVSFLPGLVGVQVAKQLVGTVLKDSTDDAKKVRQYFDVVVKNRARSNEHWKSFYEGRGILGQ